MSFYNFIKAKYLIDLPVDEIASNTVEKMILTNIWPADYIELDEKNVHIYSPEISLMQIFEFFKAKMPWIKIQITDKDMLDAKPEEALAVKCICFNQLAGLLADVHSKFDQAFEREHPANIGATREPTIH